MQPLGGEHRSSEPWWVKRRWILAGVLALSVALSGCTKSDSSAGGARELCNFTPDPTLTVGEAVFVQRGYIYVREDLPGGSRHTRLFGRTILGRVSDENPNEWYMMTAKPTLHQEEGEPAAAQLYAIGPSSPGTSATIKAELRSNPTEASEWQDECVVPPGLSRPPDSVAMRYKGGAVRDGDGSGTWYAGAAGGYVKAPTGGPEQVYVRKGIGVDMAPWAHIGPPDDMTSISEYKIKAESGVLILQGK